MWRDSTPDLRTRSRLHQLPVAVFSSSGRNQTSLAWGTHTRSSSGMACCAISGRTPGSWTIMVGDLSADEVTAVDRQDDAGDERGGRRGEEKRRPGDVFGTPPALERRAGQDRVAAGRVV